MHWISLIGFFIIINICQAQFKNFYPSKDSTYQLVSDGNNPHISGSKSDANGSVHVTTSNVPLGNSIKYENTGQNTFKILTNSGNNNYCYIILPFIIAALMTIIHF
jgi:hypothetical protein